jgi:hypothetical protein
MGKQAAVSFHSRTLKCSGPKGGRGDGPRTVSSDAGLARDRRGVGGYIPTLIAVRWLRAASTKEIGVMLFLDDIGTMLSIAGASFAGVVACLGLLLLFA